MNLVRYGSQIRQSTSMGIWPAFVFITLAAIYPLVRFSGVGNLGGDTVSFTIAIRGVLETGELVPQGRQYYPNGYGFQALSVFVLHLTGITLTDWQIFGAFLLVIWMVFPAWLLYREWVGSGRGATLATVLLFIQPDLLFGVMRGTHEKFTRGLILLCLFLLTYSLRSRYSPRRFIGSVVAFYITLYAVITFNNFFSTSFITGILVALGLILALDWWTGSFDQLTLAIRRLTNVVFAAFVLAFLYTFYVYEPARENLLILGSMFDQVSALFLPVEETETFNPYSSPVLRAWVSPYVYFLLSAANWLILLGAGMIWLVQSVRWLKSRHRPAIATELLPWAFFGAFAFQGSLAILIDFSGALTGNVQHRILPAIGFVGAPIIARWLLSVFQTERVTIARIALAGVWIGVGSLCLFGLAKATNEPLVSNQWQTFQPTELQAIDWANTGLTGRTLWTGFDRRLVEVVEIRRDGMHHDGGFDRFEVDPGTHDFLVSDLTRLQAQRLGLTLPIEFDDFVTFDNGDVQVYHRRPESPYYP